MKKKVAVVFGGKSSEHEVSLVSAASVLRNIDKSKFEVVKIGITKEGNWLSYEGTIENIENGTWYKDEANIEKDAQNKLFNKEVDVIFPVLHGLYGEDGTIQGMCKLIGLPFVGCDVMSSAVCMDKIYSKYVLENFKIKQAGYEVVHQWEFEENKDEILNRTEKKLGYPMFIKPSNSGSSVGISKAKCYEELECGIIEALKHDRKILVEEGINGREVEVAVLGNRNAKASVPGEIIPCKEFYDYEAKYEAEDSKLLIPADLNENKLNEISNLAVKIYDILDCEGMARVDFFVDKENGSIYLNEVNTIPGFTSISMYPKLWDASGLKYTDLISRLIELAEERQ